MSDTRYKKELFQSFMDKYISSEGHRSKKKQSFLDKTQIWKLNYLKRKQGCTN